MDQDTRAAGLTVQRTSYNFYKQQTYRDYLTEQKAYKEAEKKRYVKYSERPQHSDLTDDTSWQVAVGKYRTEYKDVTLMKCAFDLIAYQQLMWELKPKTVLEFGTFHGGSAMWLSDTLSSFGLDYHIYTMDIDTDQRHPNANGYKNVTFLQGDSYTVEECFTPQLIQELPHPWLVIEDAHHNLSGIMEYLDTFLQRGDYFIAEDVNPHVFGFCPGNYNGIPEKDEHGLIDFQLVGFENVPELDEMSSKAKSLDQFMKQHHNKYVVDAKIQDMFGINCSWNFNSTLMKI